MSPAFCRATREQAKLRLLLSGPSGSGKTYTALALASSLGKKVALIDTEYGSSALYGDRFVFDRCVLETFSPEEYVAAIRTAEAAGYEVLVIDSLSHAWMGRGGTLEQVDQATGAGKPSHLAWREVTPGHQALVEAIVRSQAHVIATTRAKTEVAIEHDDKGRLATRRVGLAAVQRDGFEYDFDLFGELDLENRLTLSKSRAPGLTRRVFERPGAELAAELKVWAETGAARSPRSGPAPREVVGASASQQPPSTARAGFFARLESALTPADLNPITRAFRALSRADQAAVAPTLSRRKNEILKAARDAKAQSRKAGAA